MSDRGQITGGMLDGPLAVDDAISRQATTVKRIGSSVAGFAQILVAPDLETANVLAKSLMLSAGEMRPESCSARECPSSSQTEPTACVSGWPRRL